jgi:carboxypeptidase family protein/TonB-dependent receptor-like protein
MFTLQKVRGFVLLWVVLLAVQAPVKVQGQTTGGSLSGVISDQSSARLPAATVTITNLDTGISRSLQSDTAGRYKAVDLELGNYEVRAELAGFRTAIRRGIQLTVAENAVVDLTLSVGEVTEQVEVTAEAPLVDTTSATLSGLVDDKKIRELPLNGRSFEQLAFLQPGVIPFLRGVHAVDQGAGTKFSVGGSRYDANSFLVDGININDQSNSTPGSAAGVMLGVEMLREFRVLTSNYGAEYGRYSGGVINAATKSGTNELHGSLFYFHRNDNLDARNFFDQGSNPPEFKRNQFGGTVGGPIRRDKTFFFGGYEGLRERLGLSNSAIVPNAAAHAGTLPDPATGQLRTVAVDPSVKPFLDLYPLPNGKDLGDGTAQFFSSPSKPTREDYTTVRLDHKFSDSDFFFARYTFDDSNVAEPTAYPSISINHITRAQNAAVEEKRIFSPQLLNAARVGFSRSFGMDANHPLFDVTPSLLFVPGQQLGLITFRGTGITTFGGGSGAPRIFGHNVWQVSDDVTLTRGSHSLKTGMLFERYDSNATLARTFGGQYFFNTLADFLSARPSEFDADIPGTDNVRGWRQSLLGFYVQDDVQARSNLTFNLGLRYEFTTVPTEVHGKLANWRHPLTDTQATVGEPWFQGTKKDFSPRIGFSWAPRSDGKTAIRGGFGIFFDHLIAMPLNRAMSRIPPFSLSAAVTTAPQFPRYDLTQVQGNPRAITSYALDYHMKDPTKLSWNFSVQQEIARQTVFTAAYVGSHSYHLVAANNGNDALPAILADGSKFFAAGLPRRNPSIGQLQFFITPDGNAFYHSLQLSFNRRFSRGLQLQASYTFSKNLNDSDGVLSRTVDTDQGIVPQDPDNRRADRGPAVFDIRNVLSFNYSYELPVARNLAGVAGKFLSGWQLNGITSMQSGTPVTAWVGFSRARNLASGSQITDRPNLRPGFSNDPTGGVSAGCAGIPAGARLGGPDRYFDACAFTLQDAGFYGNLGRNTIIAPGLVDFDASLVKNTPFLENKNLQFRAEFFNVFNHANFNRPSVTRIFANAAGDHIGSSGIITSTLGSSRQLQFGLRITF